jgi:sigma-B regulation protein RsbU (phosphoserine phosphatase)
MPGMDGFDVCRQIQADSELSDIPVIFLTSLGQPNDKSLGFKVGGVDYITKPVEPVELLARLKTHLSLSRSKKSFKEKMLFFEDIVNAQTQKLDQIRGGQECLLKSPELFPELNIAVCIKPILEDGGDFYDIIKLSDSSYGFFVADISGHDIGISYLTGAIKALVASFVKEPLSVNDTMILMNESLRKFLPVGVYITAVYVRIFRDRMMADIVVAGHPAPIIQHSDGTFKTVNLTGDALGAFDNVKYESMTIDIQTGDRIYLFTDGLTEAYSNYHQNLNLDSETGNSLLLKTLTESKGLSIHETVNRIGCSIENSGIVVNDDIIVLGIDC